MLFGTGGWEGFTLLRRKVCFSIEHDNVIAMVSKDISHCIIRLRTACCVYTYTRVSRELLTAVKVAAIYIRSGLSLLRGNLSWEFHTQCHPLGRPHNDECSRKIENLSLTLGASFDFLYQLSLTLVKRFRVTGIIRLLRASKKPPSDAWALVYRHLVPS